MREWAERLKFGVSSRDSAQREGGHRSKQALISDRASLFLSPLMTHSPSLSLSAEWGDPVSLRSAVVGGWATCLVVEAFSVKEKMKGRRGVLSRRITAGSLFPPTCLSLAPLDGEKMTTSARLTWCHMPR